MSSTPGPWEFDGPPHNIIVWSSSENRICFMTSDGPAEANARLIAAAPDLLVAAKAKRDAIYRHEHAKADELLLLALAKAEGPASEPKGPDHE